MGIHGQWCWKQQTSFYDDRTAFDTYKCLDNLERDSIYLSKEIEQLASGDFRRAGSESSISSEEKNFAADDSVASNFCDCGCWGRRARQQASTAARCHQVSSTDSVFADDGSPRQLLLPSLTPSKKRAIARKMKLMNRHMRQPGASKLRLQTLAIV